MVVGYRSRRRGGRPLLHNSQEIGFAKRAPCDAGRAVHDGGRLLGDTEEAFETFELYNGAEANRKRRGARSGEGVREEAETSAWIAQVHGSFRSSIFV